jgi:tripartite-type tricarboxylate transporter receptor subunit TctC
VQVLFSGLPPVMAQIAAGKVRALAIAGPRRAEALPEVPTLAEAGLPGAEVVVWYGLIAPAGTPQEAITRPNRLLKLAQGCYENSIDALQPSGNSL